MLVCNTAICSFKKNLKIFGGGYIKSVDYCKLAVRTVVGEDIRALKMAVHQYNHCSMVLNDHKESKEAFFFFPRDDKIG